MMFPMHYLLTQYGLFYSQLRGGMTEKQLFMNSTIHPFFQTTLDLLLEEGKIYDKIDITSGYKAE